MLELGDEDAVDDEEEGEAAPASGLRRRRGGEIRRGSPGDGGVQWHRRRLGDGGAVVATGTRGDGIWQATGRRCVPIQNGEEVEDG